MIPCSGSVVSDSQTGIANMLLMGVVASPSQLPFFPDSAHRSQPCSASAPASRTASLISSVNQNLFHERRITFHPFVTANTCKPTLLTHTSVISCSMATLDSNGKSAHCASSPRVRSSMLTSILRHRVPLPLRLLLSVGTPCLQRRCDNSFSSQQGSWSLLISACSQ